MNKEYLLKMIRAAIAEHKQKRIDLMQSSLSYNTKTSMLSRLKRELSLLSLFEYMLMYMPGTFQITDDEMVEGLERLCFTRPQNKASKIKADV